MKTQEEQALAALNEKMKTMNAKADSTLQKTMIKWSNDQESVIVQAAWTGWKEAIMKRKEDEALESMNAKMLHLQQKAESTLQNLMVRWSSDQASVVVQAVFMAWRDDLRQAREDAELGRLNDVMLGMKAKEEATLQS